MAGGYHLFSSGEVLTAANANNYLMNQTVMVFASAAARTTALSGVLAEGMTSYRTDSHVFEVYNGTAWVASETNLTTKGDLATYDTAPNRLAVGTDGQILMANSGSTPGLAWVGYSPAGKNAIINGGMDIWQRGTSFAIAASGNSYLADRWQSYAGVSQALTISRQATADTTNLPNIQYCMRYQRNAAQTGTGGISLATTFDTANSIQFAGKAVTMSFYARAGANYSPTSSVLGAYLNYGTGTDQNYFAGFTGATTVMTNNATLTTTWQRFSYTGNVPATATQLAAFFYYAPTGTAGANDYYEITGVQLELGSVPTTFTRAGGSIGGELQLCQRYLPVTSVADDLVGYSTTTTSSIVRTTWLAQPRVNPTGVTASVLTGDLLYNGAGVSGLPTAVAFNDAGQTGGTLVVTTTAGTPTLTAGQGAHLYVGTQILWTGCEL